MAGEALQSRVARRFGRLYLPLQPEDEEAEVEAGVGGDGGGVEEQPGEGAGRERERPGVGDRRGQVQAHQGHRVAAQQHTEHNLHSNMFHTKNLTKKFPT